MLALGRNDFANPVIARADDVLDAPGCVELSRLALSLLRDENDFVTAAVVPAQSHPALVPDNHLFEVERFVHPKRPAGELRIGTASTTTAAAAAAAAAAQFLCRNLKEPARKF